MTKSAYEKGRQGQKSVEEFLAAESVIVIRSSYRMPGDAQLTRRRGRWPGNAVWKMTFGPLTSIPLSKQVRVSIDPDSICELYRIV